MKQLRSYSWQSKISRISRTNIAISLRATPIWVGSMKREK